MEKCAFYYLFFKKNVQIYLFLKKCAILLKSDCQFKGALTENFVLQQLQSQFETKPRYYATKNMEIDFVIQHDTEIIPIEFKAGEEKSATSFKKYIKDNSPEHAFRFSNRGYKKDGAFTNVPLYLTSKLSELL